MIFEIINPSDQCTLVADDLEIAAIICCLIGTGKYALKGLDTDLEVPLFIFGGHDEWFTGKFSRNYKDSLEYAIANKIDELIACAESVMIGGLADRHLYEQALSLIDDPTKQNEYRDSYLDKKRSSLNNICSRSWQYAEYFKGTKENG